MDTTNIWHTCTRLPHVPTVRYYCTTVATSPLLITSIHSIPYFHLSIHNRAHLLHLLHQSLVNHCHVVCSEAVFSARQLPRLTTLVSAQSRLMQLSPPACPSFTHTPESSHQHHRPFSFVHLQSADICPKDTIDPRADFPIQTRHFPIKVAIL